MVCGSVAGSVCVSDSLRFAPVLSGEKGGTFIPLGAVCLYMCPCMSSVCVKWTSAPCENLSVRRKETVVCARERKRNRQPLFSRPGSETAGRDNNRSCYILVVSLISA